MKHQINTEIDIKAPTTKVWEILMDFSSYKEWNPFISSIEGHAKVGAQLNARISNMTIRPRVLEVESNKRFSWLGHLGVRGLFDGHHQFELQPLSDGGTKLLHYEHFSGLLNPLFRQMLNRKTRDGFIAMNEALRLKAENS